MHPSNSPAVDALENDFEAFFRYITQPEEAQQIGGMGGVPPMESQEQV